MMNQHKLQFRLFLERTKDIFGFDAEFDSKNDPKPADDKPIQPFRSNDMMEHLARSKVGVHEGFQDFSNTVQWGRGPGSIRVRIGSQYTAYVERQVNDLEGNKIWLTKKVFKLYTDEYKHYVENVGDSLHEEVEKISAMPLDGPSKKYEGVEDLTHDIADEMGNYANDMFVFDRFKKVDDRNSILVYTVKGGGVGALQTVGSRGSINQVVVDVNFVEASGTLRIMTTAVVTGDEGHSWHLMPSFFNGEYAPSQSNKEIAQTVVTAMKWF